MKLVLSQSNLEPFVPAEDLKVIIACENSTNIEEACTLLKRLGCENELPGRLIYSWWNFECLSISVLRQLAAQEAAAADLVIIAAKDGPRLPREVADWMQLWLASAKKRTRALVAMIDSEPDQESFSTGIRSQLKKLAGLGHLNFFAKGNEAELAAALHRGSSATVRQFDRATSSDRHELPDAVASWPPRN